MITQIITKNSVFKHHQNGFYLKVTIDKLSTKSYIESREYESEADALIAQGIIETLINKTGEIRIPEYDFLVKACLRLIDSPNKY
mgnify:CR=1 FL=1